MYTAMSRFDLIGAGVLLAPDGAPARGADVLLALYAPRRRQSLPASERFRPPLGGFP